MKTYKIGDTIKFRIRIAGDPTVDNPTVIVRDELDGVFATLTLGSGLTQVGSTKVVVGSFVPDELGAWSLQALDDTGMDRIKQYYVGDYSLDSVGALTATVEGKIDAQNLVLAQILSNSGSGGGHFG